MRFGFGLRWPKGRRRSHQSGTKHGVSMGHSSMVGGLKDEQYESSGSPIRESAAVLQPATAHGASPTILESKPSLFRRTLSSLSLRATPKVNADTPATSGRTDAPVNGNRSGESADGRRGSESHTVAEADQGKKGTTLHSLLPFFHGPLNQPSHVTSPGGRDCLSDQTLSSLIPITLPHRHLLNLIEGKAHHAAQHSDVSSGADNSVGVLKVLQEATDHAKRIVETARGERETLMGRARAEAEEEIKALRVSLEQEGLILQSEEVSAVEESLRVATTAEENLLRQLLEVSQENMAASVTLCVDYVLNVDTSLAPEHRDVLRNLKNNPPSFFRKSQAHKYPSVRNSSSYRPSRSNQGFSFSDHSWDLDLREFTPTGSGTESRSALYAAILGERSYNDEEDEVQIDFDELDRPSPIKRFSIVIQKLQSSCGCFLG